MNAIPGNPYEDTAQRQYNFVSTEARHMEKSTVIGESILTSALATLTLAYEQRTANLIALFTHLDAQGDLPDHTYELSGDIFARLGLGGDS